VSRQAVVFLIGATTSTTGLKVYAQLDAGRGGSGALGASEPKNAV